MDSSTQGKDHKAEGQGAQQQQQQQQQQPRLQQSAQPQLQHQQHAPYLTTHTQVLQAAPDCIAIALANMLWACMVLQDRPGSHWLQCAEVCLLGQLQGGGCPVQVACTCVFSLGVLQHQVGVTRDSRVWG